MTSNFQTHAEAFLLSSTNEKNYCKLIFTI
jgi:hypothetical protein